MGPTDINSKTHIELDVENNDKDPRFRVGDQVKVWIYKNISGKC